MNTVKESEALMARLVAMLCERFNAVQNAKDWDALHPLVSTDVVQFESCSQFSLFVAKKFPEGREACLGMSWRTGIPLAGEERWCFTVETADGNHGDKYAAARRDVEIAASAAGREELNETDCSELANRYLQVETGGTFKPIHLSDEFTEEGATNLLTLCMLFAFGS